MGGRGHGMTLRTLAALVMTVGLTASAVLAAAPPRASQPRADRDAAPAARAGMKGWVAAAEIEGESEAELTVVTQNGRFEVRVSPSTDVLRSDDGSKMSARDLAAALPVDVQGSIGSDAVVHAAVVTVGPLPATTATERLNLKGRILATFPATRVTGQRDLLVMTSARGEAVLEVDKDTAIVSDSGKVFGFEDLRAGQALQVEALGTTLAVARATAITVNQNGSPPSVTVDGMLLARGSLPNKAERWLVGEMVVRVPEDLAAANRGLPLATHVSVTAKRSLDDGELQALKIRPLTQAARPQIVDLRGRVDRWDGAMLLVDGVALTVRADLVAPGNLVVGSFVRVKALMDGEGRLVAQSIDVLTPGRVEVQFEGPIDEIGGDVWKVAGVTVRISGDTKLSGDKPGVASHAEVSGAQDAAKVVHATSIRVTSSLTPSSLQLEGRLLKASSLRPSVWTVQGRDKVDVAVLVSERTIVEENNGVAAVGAWVQVRGTRDGSDQVVAERIKVR